MKQSRRAKETLEEMLKEQRQIKHYVLFREYIGFEKCLKIFNRRYKKLIDKNLKK